MTSPAARPTLRSGACGSGGHIIVSAWGTGPPSNLSWTTGSGDVRPTSARRSPPPTGGDITLNACGTITHGRHLPRRGGADLTSTDCDNTKPDIPVITVANGGPVFKTDLWALCSSGSSISGMKFNDLNANGVKDPGSSPASTAG